MTNTANVENAGSINNPPGYFTNTCLLQKLSGAITSSSFGIEMGSKSAWQVHSLHVAVTTVCHMSRFEN